MILFIFVFFKAEDVVKSTTKYIPAVMIDRRKDVSSMTLKKSTLTYSNNSYLLEVHINLPTLSTPTYSKHSYLL